MPQTFAAPGDNDRNGSTFGSILQGLNAESVVAQRYLLILRYAVINATALALVGAVWSEGWLKMIFAGDSTNLVVAIIAVFLAGIFLCTRKVWQTSIELNQLKELRPLPGTRVAEFLERSRALDGQGRANLAAALRLKLATRIALIKHIANSLVLLGLIGTVLGFIIALSGVNPETASDVSAVGPMVSLLISGMSVALYTTLVGSILNMWLMMNYRLLETGTVHLLTQLVDRAEHYHADP